MLSCRGLATIASEYIDDELGTVNKLSVRMHLLMCPRCRSFIGGLRETSAILKRQSDLKVREEYLRQIDEQIQRALAERDTD